MADPGFHEARAKQYGSDCSEVKTEAMKTEV